MQSSNGEPDDIASKPRVGDYEIHEFLPPLVNGSIRCMAKRVALTSLPSDGSEAEERDSDMKSSPDTSEEERNPAPVEDPSWYHIVMINNLYPSHFERDVFQYVSQQYASMPYACVPGPQESVIHLEGGVLSGSQNFGRKNTIMSVIREAKRRETEFPMVGLLRFGMVIARTLRQLHDDTVSATFLDPTSMFMDEDLLFQTDLDPSTVPEPEDCSPSQWPINLYIVQGCKAWTGGYSCTPIRVQRRVTPVVLPLEQINIASDLPLTIDALRAKHSDIIPVLSNPVWLSDIINDFIGVGLLLLQLLLVPTGKMPPQSPFTFTETDVK